MISPQDWLDLTIRPTLKWLGSRYASVEAEVMLAAIAIQESALDYRAQFPTGPARSYWQIEPQTAQAVYNRWPLGKEKLDLLGISGDPKVWCQWCDTAACIVARGILWLDPKPLPLFGEVDKAWSCYIRNWRPGKPRPEKWPRAYTRALDAVGIPTIKEAQ